MRLTLPPSLTRRVGLPFTGLASLLIGMIQILWSATPLFSDRPGFKRSPFAMALIESGIGEEWLCVMLLTGVLLSIASITLFRTLRHVALILSGWVLLATFPVLWGYGLHTPLSFTVPVLGIYCMVLLWLDVQYKEKRRHGSD